MALVFRVEGEEDLLESGLNSFARYHGWTESSESTKLEVAREALRKYLRDSIKSYNVEAARAAAGAQAHTATEAALANLTSTIEEVSE